MIIDKGFSVINYVGTYNITHTKDGTDLIVSNEYKPTRCNERELQTKTLFTYDARNWDYISLHLANVNIKKNKSILEYCNKYGLPYSSTKISDEQPGFYIMGLDVDEVTYARCYPHYRQDTMSKFEFCRHVTTVRNLLRVKSALENNPRSIEDLLPSFLSLLLFDRKYIYDFDSDDPTPESSVLRFQYYFLSYIKKKYDDVHVSLDVQVLNFINDYYMHVTKPKEFPVSVEHYQDLKGEIWLNLYQILIDVFLENRAEVLNVDEYGNVSIKVITTFKTETINSIYQHASIVLCETINEYLIKVHPILTSSTPGIIDGDWMLRYQFDGIMMELFIMLTKNNQYKKCVNPTCGCFFPALPGSNRLYCDIPCKNAVAKRLQRERDKLDPNRKRLKPGFEGRKQNKSPDNTLNNFKNKKEPTDYH